MNDSKFVLKSRTVWGILLLGWPIVVDAWAVIAPVLGFDPPSAEAAEEVKSVGLAAFEKLSLLVGLVLGLLGARTPTTKKLTLLPGGTGPGFKSHWLLAPLALVLIVALAGCAGPQSVKGALPDEIKAQLTPKLERYILLADIKTWTGVARKYSNKKFCSTVQVTDCADRQTVIVLSEVLGRIGPTVKVLRVTASADELTTYLALGTTLLLQLQAELVQVLAKEAL